MPMSTSIDARVHKNSCRYYLGKMDWKGSYIIHNSWEITTLNRITTTTTRAGCEKPYLRRDVLKTIQGSNAFVDKFCQAHAILHQLDSAGHNLPAHLHYNSTTDRRRYNLPTEDEIAIVIAGDGTEVNGMRDIILHF
ncbi:hypothetical protein HYC85_030295 [Camellia sinensis]|uniref:Uncharacterized protein n=1 Tax=Camellia sinensis TaxID=4442 RepID=A0A7J7G472_CAMSI|nr:hypothetical protein HYC85_030295 [Camellia sinensis]